MSAWCAIWRGPSVGGTATSSFTLDNNCGEPTGPRDLSVCLFALLISRRFLPRSSDSGYPASRRVHLSWAPVPGDAIGRTLYLQLQLFIRGLSTARRTKVPGSELSRPPLRAAIPQPARTRHKNTDARYAIPTNPHNTPTPPTANRICFGRDTTHHLYVFNFPPKIINNICRW